MPYEVVNIDAFEHAKDDMGNKYRAALASLTECNTFPQMFIGGTFFGGAPRGWALRARPLEICCLPLGKDSLYALVEFRVSFLFFVGELLVLNPIGTLV